MTMDRHPLNSSPRARIFPSMTDVSTRRAKPRPSTLTYRGVKLRSPVEPSQFTTSQIREAVEYAIAKNADVLARQG